MKSTITIEVPNWAEAPDWANWWAMDKNGKAFWWRDRPVIDIEGGESFWVYGGLAKFYCACSDSQDWQDSLCKRPEPEFQPPWHKVASPYDEWIFYAGCRFGAFRTIGQYEDCVDLWTTPEDLKRAVPGKVYRRPES